MVVLMVDMKNWTGSLRASVKRELRQHLHTNPVARRLRRSRHQRLLRRMFANHKFHHFVGWYLALSVLLVVSDFVPRIVAMVPIPACLPAGLARFLPAWPSPFPSAGSNLAGITGDLITAQVGVLGIMSIAIALISLIAQRDGANPDVDIYYHEALVLEVLASGIALLAVLRTQLFWPLHSLASWIFGLPPLHHSKPLLTFLHGLWLVINLCAMAHFAVTTFSFVRRPARQRLRERCMANAILPHETEESLCQASFPWLALKKKRRRR